MEHNDSVGRGTTVPFKGLTSGFNIFGTICCFLIHKYTPATSIMSVCSLSLYRPSFVTFVNFFYGFHYRRPECIYSSNKVAQTKAKETCIILSIGSINKNFYVFRKKVLDQTGAIFVKRFSDLIKKIRFARIRDLCLLHNNYSYHLVYQSLYFFL